MAKDSTRLNKIYSKTDGCCHLCHKQLSFHNYGKHGTRGAWHIEHSKAKAKGGTDHMNNLYPACIKCNIEKSTKHTQTIRNRNGQTRAPYSAEKKKQIKTNNTVGGSVIGGIIGFAVGGPWGAAIGASIGGAVGNNSSPKK